MGGTLNAGGIYGMGVDLNKLSMTTVTDPATDAATTATIIGAYAGIIITTTGVGNSQTLASPTDTTAGKVFTIVNNDTSTNTVPVVANSVTYTIAVGSGQSFIWDGSKWMPTSMGITALPVTVTQGGTGLATITDHSVMIGSGTGAVTPLAVGATGEIIIGATGADPTWSATPSGLTSLGVTTLNSDHIGEKTGSHGVVFDNNVDVGSTTAGKNVILYATRGSEMAPALEAANWTALDGWSAGSGVLTKIAGSGTATATPSGTFTVTALRTYKVTMTVSAVSGTVYYSLGGTWGRLLTATTFTDYVKATTTGKIIFSGASSGTTTITSLSVQELTESTGDITIGGKLKIGGGMWDTNSNGAIYFNSQGVLIVGTTAPSSASATSAGVAYFTGNTVINGSLTATSLLSPDLYNSSSTVRINLGTANTVDIFNTTNQQTLRVNNTWSSSGSNYERLSLTGVAGASVNLTAETAGTGGDNLDIVLTPAGTGLLKNVSSAITSGTGTGLTVNHTGAIQQQLYKVTTTYAAYSDSDLTKGIVIATLPAKTRLVSCYSETTVAYAGTDITAATLELGITTEGAAEIIAVHDVFAGAVTKGLADADMGTAMTRAAQIQGAYTPSFTGTTAIYATIDATTGAATTLANLTAGSTTFYLITERLP